MMQTMLLPGAAPVAIRDQSRAIGAMTLAGGADPVCRWCWPDAGQFLEAFPAFIRAFGGAAFSYGSAYEVAACAGAALWLPPDIDADETEVAAVIKYTVAPALREAMFSLMEQVGTHQPVGPHWYLPLIGVEPAHQGRGLGARLMQPILQRCDEKALPAYLASTQPRNIPFYKRLGFRSTGAIRAGSSPTVTPMVREPQ